MALLVSAISVRAQFFYKVEEVDKVPYPTYMTDITYNPDKQTLSFMDTYRNDEAFDRFYTVEFYSGRSAKLCKLTHDSEVIYQYGIRTGSGSITSTKLFAEGSVPIESQFTVGHSTGGLVSTNISKQLATCISEGYGSLRVFISGRYRDKEGFCSSYETDRTLFDGAHMNNYIDIHVARFNELELSAPKNVKFGNPYRITCYLQGCGQTAFRVQSSPDSLSWNTIQSGTVSWRDAGRGYTIVQEEEFNKRGKIKDYYRVIVEDVATGLQDTSNVEKVTYLYQWDAEYMDGNIYYSEPGTERIYPSHVDCKHYQISGYFPVETFSDKDGMHCIQPACNASISLLRNLYEVKFLDADYTVLKTETVACGESAHAPEEPSIPGYRFKEWSRDFSHVRSDLRVVARYDMIGDYRFDVRQTSHTNPVFPMDGFAESTTRAMVGDQVTFAAEVCTPGEARVYYEVGSKQDNGSWTWTAPSDNNIGVFSAADAAKGTPKSFEQTVEVAYQYGQESAFRSTFGFRFFLNSAGATLYSDPFELEVYYPIRPETHVENGNLYEILTATNSDGDRMVSGEQPYLPVRYNDTVRIYRAEGKSGACLRFQRVNKPAIDLESGVDANGNAWFLCPGESETVQVSSPQYAVVFDEAMPTQPFDFTPQGNGKYNAYYAELVTCGAGVRRMPSDPVEKNRLFKGWFNNSPDAYADDDYLHVPALNTPYIYFSASWEDLPEASRYYVNFFGKDGVTQLGSTQVIEEGQDATPPEAPEEPGHHFAGWDQPFTAIKEDMSITALYGKDGTNWTVTYYDEDGITRLGEEQVADQLPAKGLTLYKEGNRFVGWMNRNTGDMEPLLHVAEDLQVKAVFEAAQGIESVESGKRNVESRKVLRDGQLIIIKGGAEYSILGIRQK